MNSIRVAIAGVGNCAASLVQGVHYYADADPDGSIPGLMHVRFGDYHVGDVTFVAAFDVDANKVGLDLSDAIGASERLPRGAIAGATAGTYGLRRGGCARCRARSRRGSPASTRS